IPRTVFGLSGMRSGSPRSPAKPCRIPITSQPRFTADNTAVRMTAFSPGASPPPVRRPIFIESARLVSDTDSTIHGDCLAAESKQRIDVHLFYLGKIDRNLGDPSERRDERLLVHCRLSSNFTKQFRSTNARDHVTR